jgi:TonB family protein
MTDVPEPPPPSPPEPPPVAEPTPAATASAVPQRPAWLPLAIGAGAAVVLLLGFFVWQTQFAGRPDANAYTVQAYTPPSELISARDRVPGRAAPDDASPVSVEFGPGVTLNVTGRVSRGLGDDWYAVAWNDQTVFVRAGDAVAGSGAPPIPDVRERPEEEEELDKEKPEEVENPFDEEDVAEASPSTPSGTLDIGDVDWIREPSARDFARFYPNEALDDDRSGRVTLDCAIGGNGRLDCSVASESPSGYGFGQAALGISRQLRVQPTLPDGSSAVGRHLRLPLSFRAG